jgi:2'-5' RNA ligase
MKATFVLLANQDVHNLVRKLSWEIHQKYRTGTHHAALPPHVSLKQPFNVSDLPALERYMDELANSIQPFEVTLTELQAVPIIFDGMEYGILWVDVEETEILRELHNRLNHDLNLRFGDTPADFDGDAYRFHMTVMMCGQLMEICRKYQSDIQLSRIDLRYTARELAMFVYDEPMGPHGDDLCYRIVPLGHF